MPKKDLRQMKNDKQKERCSQEDVRKAAQQLNVDASNIDDNSIRSVEETIAQYENKSESELMSDLERMIYQGRQDGTFTDEMLDGFIQNVAPMLDGAQRERLNHLARMIKMNKI